LQKAKRGISMTERKGGGSFGKERLWSPLPKKINAAGASGGRSGSILERTQRYCVRGSGQGGKIVAWLERRKKEKLAGRRGLPSF